MCIHGYSNGAGEADLVKLECVYSEPDRVLRGAADRCVIGS